MEKVVRVETKQGKSVLDPQTGGAMPEKKEAPVLRKFTGVKKKEWKGPVLKMLLGVVVVAGGVGVGWVLVGGGGGGGVSNGMVDKGVVKTGETEAGMGDESMFPDQAEGMLKEGGIDGEGTHYLDREEELGPGKNVYLFSTMIDLQGFVGKKVKIWGQTVSGQKTGWLMEVGKIKVID